MDNFIPLKDCKNRFLYRLIARNFNIGVFNAADRGFIGIREKLGEYYLFTEFHKETSESFGTVRPIECLMELPHEIKCQQRATHEHGEDWTLDPISQQYVPSIRRDLRDGEKPHGNRRGFVDEWLNGERLPDNLYPRLRQNQELFDWLNSLSF